MRAGALSLALLAVASPVFAHLGSTKFIHAERTEAGAQLTIDIEMVDVAVELSLGEDAEERAVAARAAATKRWIREGITLTRGGIPCAARFGETDREDPVFVDRDERRFVRAVVRYECTADGPLVLRDETVFADDEQHESMVQFAWAGQETAAILRRGRQEVELSDPPSGAALFGTFLVEGMLHFALGFDHVLFLLSLVLAAGYVSRKTSLRKALRDVAILVTAFTLGHSVTLIAAALEWVVLPTQPVEVVIAASIVVVAVLNIVRPEQRGPMPWLALIFGLIHGFGFSSVLAEVGLPGSGRVIALLAFNLGIEVAQLAFVAIVLGPIAWMAERRWYDHVVRGGSVLIALLAAWWVVERIGGW